MFTFPVLLLTISKLFVESSEISHFPCPVNCSCRSPPDSRTGCSYPNLRLNCLPTRRPEKFAFEIDRLLKWNDSSVFSNVLVLKITKTPMNAVQSAVCDLTKLRELVLNSNRLTELPPYGCFQNMSNLRSFSASHNQVRSIANGTFNGLRNLNRLDLSYNELFSIEYSAFLASAGLDSLTFIDMHRNFLTSLDTWVVDRGLYGTIERRVAIDLSNNPISSFTNMAGWRVNCGGPRSFAKLDLSWNNLTSVSEIRHGWNLTEIEYIFCLTMKSVDLTQFVTIFGINFHGYNFDCSCKDFKYFIYDHTFNHANIFRGMYCNTPEELNGIEIPRVPLDRFVCVLTGSCPSGCRCIQQPSNLTIHVVCSATYLSSLPERLPSIPKYRYRLVFANCRQLRTLDFRPYFTSTFELDVSGSAVDGVTHDRVWNDLLRIPKVSLTGNSLRRLPILVNSTSVTTKQLSLGNNPWICSCSDSWLIQWMTSLGPKLQDAGDVMCDQPNRLSGRNVLSATDDDFCVDPVVRAITISVTTIGSAFFVCLVVLGTMYRFRVSLFTRWKFHPFDRDECLGGHFDDDVFISAAEDDHDTLARGLVESLEARRYRVYYGPRDIVCGASIDSVCVAITRSKRTMCLLTENYLQSPTCLFEFDFALHHNLIQLRKKRLIVLSTLDDPIAAVERGDWSSPAHSRNWKQFDVELLRQYLKQYPYINYRKAQWIDKLLYCLPITGMLQQEQRREDERTPLL